MRDFIEIKTPEVSNDLKVEIPIFDIGQKKIQIQISIEEPKTYL
jgi:hypothetical protein